MSILENLASALGRADERPHVELAEALVARPDPLAVAELVAALGTGSAAVQNDAIKVLYEIGARRPELVAPHVTAFFALLGSRNNRNVWGALQAIDSVTTAAPAAVLAQLPAILGAADKSTVIAKDRAMSILAKLAAAGHGRSVLPVLLDRLEAALPNQFPMYAEVALPVIDTARRPRLAAILEARLDRIEQPAKRRRVETVLKKLRDKPAA